MIFNKLNFIEYHELINSISVYTTNEKSMKIIARGFINFQFLFFNEIITNVIIRNVLHVFDLIINLFSMFQIIQIDCSIMFDNDDCIIIDKKFNIFILHFSFVKNQYFLNITRIMIQIIVFEIFFNTKYNEKTFKF